MPSNLAIYDRLLAEAQKVGQHRTKRETVNAALKDTPSPQIDSFREQFANWKWEQRSRCYLLALRRASEEPTWRLNSFIVELACAALAVPQSLRSSLGSPSGPGSAVLSMQGMALRYS